MKTQEELRNLSEDELWEYFNRPNPHPINEGKAAPHFNTMEEWREYYSDGHEVNEFVRIMRDEYGV